MGTPAPKTIGSYAVERELGRGGMGIVYLGRHPVLDRPVVLKTLRKEIADEPASAARFAREAQAAAAIHHQNVVAVYDSFAWRTRSYICQEFVDGIDLASAMRSVGRIEPRITALIALELTRGLEAIHSHGVVHRDVKPSNVLISHRGEVKVADFGIALDARGKGLTQTGHSVGTPRYMSPEQLYGERVDLRSDLFSVGVALYEMLTARAPFDDVSPAAGADDDGALADSSPSEGDGLIRRIEAERYPRPGRVAPGVPRALARLVKSCLRAKPRRRMASAEQLRRQLERLCGAPSQLEAQREIAAWLAAHELIDAESDATAAAPVAVAKRPGLSAPLRWAAAVAAIATLAASAWAFERTSHRFESLARSASALSFASSSRF